MPIIIKTHLSNHHITHLSDQEGDSTLTNQENEQEYRERPPELTYERAPNTDPVIICSIEVYIILRGIDSWYAE